MRLTTEQRRKFHERERAARDEITALLQAADIPRSYRESLVKDLIVEMQIWLEDRPQMTSAELDDLLQ